MNNIYFLIVGIIFTIFGVGYPALKISHRLACSQKVTATVSKLNKTATYHHRGRTSHRYIPSFTYTVDGKQYTAKADIETQNTAKYAKGKEFIIRYNPKKPEEISVGVSVFPYLSGGFATVIGIALIICYFL